MSWSEPDALWGLSFFERHSINFEETWMSDISVNGLDWNHGDPVGFLCHAFSDVGD